MVKATAITEENGLPRQFEAVEAILVGDLEERMTKILRSRYATIHPLMNPSVEPGFQVSNAFDIFFVALRAEKRDMIKGYDSDLVFCIEYKRWKVVQSTMIMLLP